MRTRSIPGVLALFALLGSRDARADALAALSGLEIASAPGAAASVAADLDGDGSLDLAVAFPDHVLVRYANETEVPLPHQASALAAGEHSLHLALVEGAILAVDLESGEERVVASGLVGVTSAASGDFDGDGARELLLATPDAVLAVGGDGTTDVFAESVGIRRLVPGDFSGQGLVDLAMETDSGALILPGAGPSERIVDGPEMEGLAAIDTDGDRRDEIAGLLQGEILVLEMKPMEPAFAPVPSVVEDIAPFLLYTIDDLFPGTFVRGDPNADRSIDISDALAILLDLFAGVPARADCRDALDVDDSGILNTTDAVRLLDFLFRGGAAPPAPFPGAGEDPTPDAIPCA